jgi:endonuclease YncB( thermonuclease family)
MQRTVLFALLFLASCDPELPTSQRMKVQSAVGGNEIEMTSQGQTYRVKLCGVDVPAGQDSQARKLLEKLNEQADEQEKGLVVVEVLKQGNTITAEVESAHDQPG